MLIECGGLSRPDDADSVSDPQPDMEDTVEVYDERSRAAKLALLELLLAAGIDVLFARADGSGDEGSIEELHCYVQVTEENREECEVPTDAEDMVQELLDATQDQGGVNFNGDGGFWELTMTTATRECAVECGWYYTTSDSTTTTETL